MVEIFEKNPKALPFGDDVSAVEISKDLLMILKSDMLVGKTHVPPGMTLRQAARKAVVINVSDFAAKGVKPLAVSASIGFPAHFSDRDVRQLAEGLNDGAREYGAYVIGGDTNEAEDLVIACSIAGICKKGEIITRSGCKPGDVVAVTDHFGTTGAGFKLLFEGVSVPRSLRNKILEPVYVPKARLREGLALARSGAVTASIDSSDGLAWSLYELQRASKVGFLIDTLPLSPEAMEFAKVSGADPFELVFYGGEEYELVVSVNKEKWALARDSVEKIGGRLVRIGVAVEEPELVFKRGAEEMRLEPRGFEHFR
jgi:thiamine-monophosphate kinase